MDIKLFRQATLDGPAVPLRLRRCALRLLRFVGPPLPGACGGDEQAGLDGRRCAAQLVLLFLSFRILFLLSYICNFCLAAVK